MAVKWATHRLRKSVMALYRHSDFGLSNTRGRSTSTSSSLGWRLRLPLLSVSPPPPPFSSSSSGMSKYELELERRDLDALDADDDDEEELEELDSCLRRIFLLRNPIVSSSASGGACQRNSVLGGRRDISNQVVEKRTNLDNFWLLYS